MTDKSAVLILEAGTGGGARRMRHGQMGRVDGVERAQRIGSVFGQDLEAHQLLVVWPQCSDRSEYLLLCLVADDDHLRTVGIFGGEPAVPLFERCPPSSAAVVIADHIARNAVQPQKRFVLTGDPVRTPERNEEDLRYGLVGVFDRQPAQAVRMQGPMVGVKQGSKPVVCDRCFRHPSPSPFVSATYMSALR